jgi:hypothetical protein
MNIPTRYTPAIAAGLALLASLAAAAATEARPVAEFTAVAVSAPVRVEVALGERDGVELEGDAGAIARIETTVEKGVLRIRLKERSLRWDYKVVAHVTARRIGALSVAGSGDVHAKELRGEALAIDVAGSGDVIVDAGKVGSLNLNIAGSGDVRMAKVEARSVSVSIAGSGDAIVWARESLSVSVVGSGDVRYYGDPAVSRSIVGSGDIRRLAAAPS